MYLQNKYTTWYNRIVNSARTRDKVPSKYTEVHHILPKSLGGTNDPSNLIELTPKEHFICHLLLTKMVTGPAKRSMSYALWGMTNQQRKDQNRYKVRSSRLYEYAKNLANESLSIERKGKTLEELYGAERASEIKKNMQKRRTRSSPTPEERKKLGQAVSDSWKRNTGPCGFQIKQPIKISCPRCGKTMDKGNYIKYGHGIRCS